MQSPWITIAAVVALGSLYVLFPLALHTFQRYRHKRVLECPETKGLAEVDIDAPLAARSSLFGRIHLRVKNCSIWPKRSGCAQGCIKD
jgi:hypothetical protein